MNERNAGTFNISRRAFFRTGAMVTGAAIIPVTSSAQAESGRVNFYESYGWLRGFNVVPSWGARIEDAWWFYTPERMREEVGLARQVHANCIRLWIEFTAWMRDPEKVTADFLDAVAAIAETGMKVMPCIFNRWHDARFDYGGTYTETLLRRWAMHLDYVRALVTPLASDQRVLVWDMCNEPQSNDQTSSVNQKEFLWLSDIAKTIRECGAKQPITVGTMSGKNIEIFAPLVDVLCGHPYVHSRKELEEKVASFDATRKQFGKPFLVNECIPGSLDDAARGEMAHYYTELLAAAGMGWMGWALREGKAISTRRDRYDANGLNREGFHPFFTKNGKLRDGLDFLKEKPQLLAPWERS